MGFSVVCLAATDEKGGFGKAGGRREKGSDGRGGKGMQKEGCMIYQPREGPSGRRSGWVG